MDAKQHPGIKDTLYFFNVISSFSITLHRFLLPSFTKVWITLIDEVSKQDKEVSKENSLENLETNKTEKGGKEYKKVNKLSKTKKTVPSEKLKDENRLQEGESKMADTEGRLVLRYFEIRKTL